MLSIANQETCCNRKRAGGGHCKGRGLCEGGGAAPACEPGRWGGVNRLLVLPALSVCYFMVAKWAGDGGGQETAGSGVF